MGVTLNLTNSDSSFSTKCKYLFTLLKYQDFLLYIQRVANSGNYLHFSIVLHYKTVCNYNVLGVNYNFDSNYYIKMPPTINNKALPNTTQMLYFQLFYYFLNFY